MNKKELINKIQQDTFYIRKIFESCENKIQLTNTTKLANHLIDKWAYLIGKNNISIDIYNAYVKPAANDMENFIIETKEKIKDNNNVTKTNTDKKSNKTVKETWMI